MTSVSGSVSRPSRSKLAPPRAPAEEYHALRGAHSIRIVIELELCLESSHQWHSSSEHSRLADGQTAARVDLFHHCCT